ncbi:ubiquitin-like-specific protease ESD4 [Zingiber officinale]|uniref:ubiquitin-like-specific protease ESD4 n=1 Tax=Zingiber officinale TaxID=94328 RepID=UPI001C4CA211|nr:ubiquitin-like-specific protease ESD4 [Zingiber officinale]
MGALTENRKRRLAVDLRLSSFAHPVFDLASEPSPPSKKIKRISPPVSLCAITPLTQVALTPTPAARSFPPPSPLPRPVHGPQRILRAFGLGSANGSRLLPSPLKPKDVEMGNLVSQFLRVKKAAVFTPWRMGKRDQASSPSSMNRGSDGNDGSHEGLGLDQYVQLVNDVKDGNLVPETSHNNAVFPFSKSGLSDLRIVTQKSEETPNLHLVNRKVEDARKLLRKSSPAREDKTSVKRSPLYKELYVESARKHDTKLRNLDLEVELAEKRISSFRLIHHEEEKQFEEDLKEVFSPLTNEEEEEVDHALNDKNSCEILVVHEPSNIEITKKVLHCLSWNDWLNDEVINLYLELLKEREKREPKKFLKCHFFNTFFYKKLVSGRNGYDYKAVRRWTTQRKLGYSLIECDRIFVPIHKEIHWCLAVIHVKEKKLQYLDSLGGMDMTVLRVLAKYLMDEVKDKNGNQIDTSSWIAQAVDDLPLQKNGWDCGMFMLKYTDFYSRGLNLFFQQENMPYFRKRTAKEILRLKAD